MARTTTACWAAPQLVCELRRTATSRSGRRTGLAVGGAIRDPDGRDFLDVLIARPQGSGSEYGALSLGYQAAFQARLAVNRRRPAPIAATASGRR